MTCRRVYRLCFCDIIEVIDRRKYRKTLKLFRMVRCVSTVTVTCDHRHIAGGTNQNLEKGELE